MKEVSTFCEEPVITQFVEIDVRLFFCNQLCQITAYCRSDSETVSGKTTGDDQTGNFFHRADDRDFVCAQIHPSCPCADDFSVFQGRKIFDDAAAGTGSGKTVGYRRAVIFCEALQTESSSEHKGAVLGLMTVKISFSGPQHLIKHRGLSFCDQTLQHDRLHRHIDADGFEDWRGRQWDTSWLRSPHRRDTG